MSEYLNRLKQLRDAPITDSFQSPNVHSNVSFRKAIDYIELLEQQREADKINLDNIIKEYRMQCNGKNILVKSNVIRHLINEYYEATQ